MANWEVNKFGGAFVKTLSAYERGFSYGKVSC